MKGSIICIALFALCGSTFAINDTDVVIGFVNCTIRAATHGIDGLVPTHDPLWIRDINFTQEILGIEYYIGLTNNFLYSLMDLELKTVDVTTYYDPDALNINYDIYWPVLNFTGDYEWYVDVLGYNVSGNGTYNILMDHTDFVGLFNLTKPGQEDKGIEPHLDDFTLNITVKEVESYITGDGPEGLTNEVVKDILYYVMNHVPESVGEELKEYRFNDFWISHPERVKTVLDWCVANPED